MDTGKVTAIQSEAKNLEATKVDVFEILRHYVPLNDSLKFIHS